jgi:TetR/AcrR family transcriptional repressor of nem operon
MARPREFDPQATLQTAIQVFWEKGYANTSVDEIVQRSGVAKYGIYGTFGNKEALFKKVLAQYASDRHQDMQEFIRRPGAALAEIQEFFAAAPGLVTQADHPKGCLVCNTGVELGERDPALRDYVNDFFDEIAQVLRRCLVRAVDQGELVPPPNLDRLATYLATEFRTALMLARSGVSQAEIEQHLEIALTVLA